MIPAFIILFSVFFDGARDKANLAWNKWPCSGKRITIWKKTYTVDKWHVIKWLAFYPPLIWIWLDLPTVIQIIIIPVAYVVWQIYPKPEHWKDDKGD